MFIALKKAFDRDDHELLVEKLNVYGICGVANKWLQHNLANRKQYVVIHDDCSDLLDMTCGVPQCHKVLCCDQLGVSFTSTIYVKFQMS